MLTRRRPRPAGRILAALTLAGLLVAGCSAAPEQGPPMSTRGTPSAVPDASSVAPGSPATSAPVTSAPAPEPSTSAPPPSLPPEPPAPAVPPGGPVTAADMTAAAAAVAGMSTADRAGAVVMASSADAVGTDLVARLHLGGVILMGSKGAVDGTEGGTPAQVAAVAGELQAQVMDDEAAVPLLIGTDQESGLVTRLVNGFTDFPGADELSGIADPAAAAALTEQVTAASAAEMRAVGINVDFAPDADVLPESGVSGVAGRTFGSDPARSAMLVAAAVRGYQQGGVAATVKHFPGIGRTATDTHQALPTLDIDCAGWNAVEAVPMRGGVDAGAALVMTGHIDLPAVGTDGTSSALSSAVVTDLLKGSGVAGCEGLNFRGVAVSDSFQMAPVKNNFGPGEAAWRGIAAGQDLVLMPADPAAAVSGIVAAVDGGQLSAQRLSDAATRVYALRLALDRIPPPALSTVRSAEHEAIAARARAAG